MVVPKMREPNPRLAKRRKIENIHREYERKKAELHGAVQTTMFRYPKFYFGVIVVLALVGSWLFKATDSAVQRAVVPPHVRTLRNLDVLAEALGRYRFHVGAYPAESQGLAALVRDPQVPRWSGPYINFLRKDPWGTDFVYRPPTNGLPLLFSCGPDRLPGTPDDLRPDTARFDPGTAWTNGWLPTAQRLRGVVIVPPSDATR